MSQFAFLFGDFHHYFLHIAILLLIIFLNILNEIPLLSKARPIFLLFRLKARQFTLFRSIMNFLHDFILQNHHIINPCQQNFVFCQYRYFLIILNAKWVHPNFSFHIIFIESINFIYSSQLIWLLFTSLQFYFSTHKLLNSIYAQAMTIDLLDFYLSLWLFILQFVTPLKSKPGVIP